MDLRNMKHIKKLGIQDTIIVAERYTLQLDDKLLKLLLNSETETT